MIDNLVNSKGPLVMDNPSSLRCQVTDNPVNLEVSDGGKSIGSFLKVLAWIILRYSVRQIYPLRRV